MLVIFVACRLALIFFHNTVDGNVCSSRRMYLEASNVVFGVLCRVVNLLSLPSGQPIFCRAADFVCRVLTSEAADDEAAI